MNVHPVVVRRRIRRGEGMWSSTVLLPCQPVEWIVQHHRSHHGMIHWTWRRRRRLYSSVGIPTSAAGRMTCSSALLVLMSLPLHPLQHLLQLLLMLHLLLLHGEWTFRTDPWRWMYERRWLRARVDGMVERRGRWWCCCWRRCWLRRCRRWSCCNRRCRHGTCGGTARRRRRRIGRSTSCGIVVMLLVPTASTTILSIPSASSSISITAATSSPRHNYTTLAARRLRA